jgi:predicted DNA-binding ribbon-helix-helix protein
LRTRVKGVRADNEFWDKLKKVAKMKGVTMNYIVVNATNKYCNRVLTRKKTCDKLDFVVK